MSLLRFTASADTTITDAYRPYTKQRSYHANMGAADSLEIFSIAHSGSESEKSRILINFPIQDIISKRLSGKLPASGSVNFIFKLYNVEHPETLPKNYNIIVKPVSGSWDEGYGLDLENYTDIGQVSGSGYGVGWRFKQQTTTGSMWNTFGGDFYSGYDKTFHFDDGTEDIEVDISDIIEAQINGDISADGIAIMLPSDIEEGSSGITYYTKRFSSRSSEYYFKLPKIEARWESIINDDRNNFYYESPNLEEEDNIQNLYFYNKINGIFKDIPGNVEPFVKVLDENNNLLISDIQSVKELTGVYRASFKITGSSTAILNDIWYSGSNSYYSGEFECNPRMFEDTFSSDDYVINITNLKNLYKNYEYVNLRIFSREKNWSPNIYKVSNQDIKTLIFKNLYYKIIRLVDNETIIDYGINPIAYTKCSYDKNGNYFDLDMSFFEPGYMYGVKLVLIDGDTKKEFKNIFKFKVE